MNPGNENDRTLWEGTPQNLTNLASGGRVVGVRYRLTPLTLHIDRGIVRSDSQQIPLAAVYDVDVRQSMTQKARGVGDVLLHVDTGGHRETVVLESLPDPKQLRDYMNVTIQNAKQHYAQMGRQHVVVAQAPAAPQPSTGGRSVVDELRELAQLRDAGVLTEDEFTQQKARVLAR